MPKWGGSNLDENAGSKLRGNQHHLLNQARKYRVGLLFAHQNLDQLSLGLRSTVLASTSVKFAGGVSAKDASVLDAEFRSDEEFLLGQRKERSYTRFACFIKNYTGRALSLKVPLGFLESQLQLSEEEYRDLIERNRSLYSEQPIEPPHVPFPTPAKERAARAPGPPPTVAQPTVTTELPPLPQPAPPSREPSPRVSERSEEAATALSKRRVPQPSSEESSSSAGRGGRQHKYLQHLVKQLAEERGFRASIEETILNGAGRVDVSLVRDKTRIACQICVTTTKDWELSGIERCLAAGYSEVALIGTTERHIKSLSKHFEEQLQEPLRSRVRYLTAEGLVEYLDSLGKATSSEKVVRGYKVRTKHQQVDPEDAEERRRAITEVVARSLMRAKDD